MLLAGDVGATKIRLALAEFESGHYCGVVVEEYASRDFQGVGQVIRLFLEKHGATVSRGVLGVPGPVVDGFVRTTNLPWQCSESGLSAETGIARIRLVNDLVAATRSLPLLSPASQVQVLHPAPVAADATVSAVLSVGSGLGQGILHEVGDRAVVFASEGGHVDFGPTDESQVELWRYLKRRFQRVSYERILSGPGLVNLFEFLRDSGRVEASPALLDRFRGHDPARVITDSALAGEDDICLKTLDLFVTILGAQAGNVMLSTMATAGVYLGGGIPPKIAPLLADGRLVAAYLDKGRLSPVVARTPLMLITDDQSPLVGAAALAAEL